MVRGCHESHGGAVGYDGMLLDLVFAIDNDIDGSLAEGCDGGMAVAKRNLLWRLEITKLGKHGSVVAEGFWSGASVIAHESRWWRKRTSTSVPTYIRVKKKLENYNLFLHDGCDDLL